ncbi:MAG: methyltransferase domain-containing protein, partial [Smithella sp.]
ARQNELTAQLPVEFQMGDIKALPFPDNSFSCCRIDRVLQHIPQPQKAVVELVRVLEPGGLLLAYDNDWKTFSVASENIEITRALEDLWVGSFVNSRIGLHLSGYFISAGLTDVKIYPGTSVILDFPTANRVYNLHENVQKAIDVKIISTDQGKRWLEELIERDARGSFMATLTAYTVVGRKDKPDVK